MSQSARPRFTFLGHSTVQCRLPGGEVLLIDPWVNGNPSCPESCRSFDRIDAILITHAHEDHMGDAKDLAMQYKPEVVVGSHEVCTFLAGQGVENTSGMNLGGSQEVLGCKVSMVRADHSSSFIEGEKIIYGGLASGYVVRLPGGFTFYHAGDTALFTDLKLVGDLYRPELAFLPIGDLYTMDPEQAAVACEFLGILRVVPIHWGTFPVLTGKPERLQEELRARRIDCEMVALEPGESW